MASLLTNASAQTALRTLRSVQSNLQETQDRISTGLKVRSPKENPAFFLVAQTVKGDVAVLDGLKDNLTVGVNTAKTASAGLSGITEDINSIQSALTTAQTGTALKEVQFAIGQVVEQIEGQIDATSFNGVNLLAGSKTTTLTTTLTRDNGSFELSTFTLQAQNLDSLELAGVAQGGFTVAQAEAQFDALSRAFNSGFGDRLDENGDGSVDLTQGANSDSVITREQGAAAETSANAFTFYGSEEDRNFLASIGIATSNLGKVGNDTSRDVIEITDITAAPSQALVDAYYTDGDSGGANPYTFAGVAGYTNGDEVAAVDYNASKANAFATAGGDAFASGAAFLQNAVFSDSNLRSFANDSGFRAVARQIDVAGETTGNVQAGFVIADSLIARVNISQTVIGVFESTLDSRQNFLSDLTDSLELGVAALTEADLTEESSRLQSFQVQEQLATQALSIANQRPQSLLSLFR
ncbi:flagellin [Parvularcula maris]|uniref:Flagellin n=1 Tax=Parvularcula maris TaxID=2965077 RepID=A0A9X2RI18_9PROT|nr:flagellin [Parvularcula maris]MCQ8185504.1 flagellin [Parvularcula maris]